MLKVQKLYEEHNTDFSEFIFAITFNSKSAKNKFSLIRYIFSYEERDKEAKRYVYSYDKTQKEGIALLLDLVKLKEGNIA
ncbi:MAG: hypothetical protein ACOC1X_01935 [Promethearchaeota archaeon]